MDENTEKNGNTAPVMAAVAFVDLAGFSAIADVHGDQSALAILEIFERLVEDHSGDGGRLVKWIGGEAMLAFVDPESALISLGRLLPECRADERVPLTRSALHFGPVVPRGSDIFGTTVNVAARISAIAKPGELIATAPVAEAAMARGIKTSDLGPVSLRSLKVPTHLYRLELAEEVDPAWIDPVCKMHAPFAAYGAAPAAGPWFCSARCKQAYSESPDT